MTLAAVTRHISPALANCELTHLDRVPIDVDAARRQHDAYQRALADAGCRVEVLEATAEMPDSVFIEDTAIVFDELAVIARPGAASRRVEVPAVVDALERYRTLRFIEPPATLDGGDVLVVGRRVFVGVTTRTNRHGIGQLRTILQSYGYMVCDVEISNCLHLKSAATSLDDRHVIVNPDWIDRRVFQGFETVEVDPTEPFAANTLRLADRIVVAAAFPNTAARIRALGYRVEAVDVSELAKAEGGVTCCSLIVKQA